MLDSRKATPSAMPEQAACPASSSRRPTSLCKFVSHTHTASFTNWLSTEAVQRLKQVRHTASFLNRFQVSAWVLLSWRLVDVFAVFAVNPLSLTWWFLHGCTYARHGASSKHEMALRLVGFSFHWRARAAPDRPLQGAIIAPGRPRADSPLRWPPCRLSRSPCLTQ